MTTTLAFELRPALPGDVDFEHLLYASTRDDLRPLGPEVFDGFVGMQFRAESMSIRLDHPCAEHTIVVVDDSAAGRLIVDESGDQIKVIDLALLPEYRGQGIGTSLLRGVLDRADRMGRAIVLHVEKQSRAVRLYERLGFLISAEAGLYFEMCRV
jgi:ribosomal protein S18 acetylase RimI-like enzyme